MAMKFPDCYYCKKKSDFQITRYKDLNGVSFCLDDECKKKAISIITK